MVSSSFQGRYKAYEKHLTFYSLHLEPKVSKNRTFAINHALARVEESKIVVIMYVMCHVVCVYDCVFGDKKKGILSFRRF